LAEESLQGLVERRIVREDFARRLVVEYLPEHPGYYGEMVWILIILEQWLQAEAPTFRI
jgi:asparagine synthase (glutamine-hydrolysing)